MACNSYVIKTTNLATNKISWELKCHGDCEKGDPCEPRFWTGSSVTPEGRDGNAFKTCYCDDEIQMGMPDCDGPSPEVANNLKSCRIGLLYKFDEKGHVEEEAYDAACLGNVPKATPAKSRWKAP